jgi:hypothetical protein
LLALTAGFAAGVALADLAVAFATGLVAIGAVLALTGLLAAGLLATAGFTAGFAGVAAVAGLAACAGAEPGFAAAGLAGEDENLSLIF